MNTPHTTATNRHVAALAAPRSSIRLRAAMAIGIEPDDGLVDLLIDRCAIEPDFFVRDMLTWALTRQRPEVVVPRLLGELRSGVPQARSQALHTLSKLGVPATWAAITPELLQDADAEVARSAWRAAVAVVPAEHESELAELLAGQLGRGDQDVQRSLSRALVALGGMIEPLLAAAATHPDPEVHAHALATRRLLEDPDSAFTVSVDEALRVRALESAPQEEAR